MDAVRRRAVLLSILLSAAHGSPLFNSYPSFHHDPWQFSQPLYENVQPLPGLRETR